MPMPSPAAGGMPCSSARRKSSSIDVRLVVAGGALPQLRLEAAALIVGIVELGERVGDLPAGDEELEAVDELRRLLVAPRQRRDGDRILVHERRLDQLGLDEVLEQIEEQIAGRRLAP